MLRPCGGGGFMVYQHAGCRSLGVSGQSFKHKRTGRRPGECCMQIGTLPAAMHLATCCAESPRRCEPGPYQALRNPPPWRS